MLKFTHGRYRIGDKILDSQNFEIRPLVTETDLQKYYDSFVEHAGEIRNYFENESAFEKALKESSGEKRPLLMPCKPTYSSLFGLSGFGKAFDFMDPENRRGKDDYFVAGRCVVSIPRGESHRQDGKVLDAKLREDIGEIFSTYPGYEGLIEVSDDRSPPETKATTFHEALHYLILRYQVETGRNFVDVFAPGEYTEVDRYRAEYILHERTVGILTDKMLAHDQDSLFESRWTHHFVQNRGQGHIISTVSAITTGFLLGSSIMHPYLLPVAALPSRLRDYLLKKKKSRKREELTQPIEYPFFKI